MLIPREQQLPGFSTRGEMLYTPQRVCQPCAAVLFPLQNDIKQLFGAYNQDIDIDRHNVDRYLSLPNGLMSNNMEGDIIHAVYTLYNFTSDNAIEGKDRIPKALIKKAQGLVFLTIVKAGFFVSGRYGSGIIIARIDDDDNNDGKAGGGSTPASSSSSTVTSPPGSFAPSAATSKRSSSNAAGGAASSNRTKWSAPSALTLTGIGMGMQVGGEIMDVVLILRTKAAVSVFKANTQVSLGAGLSVTVGPVGRAAETEVRAGSAGASAAYSCKFSK